MAAATLTAKQRADIDGYKMPVAMKGQTVLWYMDGSRGVEPSAALVTRVNGRSLGLHIMNEDGSYTARDSVRHVDDPSAVMAEYHDDGAWEHTPLTLRILRMLEVFEKANPEKK